MADPKYAGLPGIAFDEPDVYETQDLPEADQTSDFYEEESDSIERLHISASEAFGKFKDKSLDGKSIDFSDRISRRLRTGYDARSGIWELVAEGEKETVLQKFQRLQCELSELVDEVSQLQKDGGDGKKKKKEEGVKEGSGVVTRNQVEEALKKLADIRLEEAVGPGYAKGLTDPQGVQLEKLISQLNTFKKQKEAQSLKPESDQKSPAGGSDGIVYQFQYRPEQSHLQQSTRVAELEARLYRLETVLGSSTDKLARLTAATSKTNLLEAAQHLSAKASMLDSAQLDHIEGRLTALAQKLESISEKKAEMGVDPEKDKMILELYELVKNSEDVTKLLPSTIERLVCLEASHKKAAEFGVSLMQLENLQSQIQSGVENNKALLQGVQESFATNLEEMNKNFANLDAKIKTIKKK